MPQSLRARSHAIGLELRLGGVGERQSLRGRRGHRNGRVDHQPREHLRDRRLEADGGSGEPRGDHPDRPQPGHRGTDGSHRGRRRRAAHSARGRGPARSGDGGRSRPCRQGLHRVSRCERIEGRTHRCPGTHRQQSDRGHGAGAGDRGAQGPGRRSRGPRPHRNGRPAGHERARRAAVRIQDGSERLPRHDASHRKAAHPRGPDRVQRGKRGPRDALLRAGDVHRGAGPGSAHRPGLPRRARQVHRAHPHQGHRRDNGQVQARRDARPLGRDRVTRRPRGRRWRPPDTHTSRSQRVSTSACRSASRSTGAPGASRCCCGWRTPSSRRPRRAGRPASTPRWP